MSLGIKGLPWIVYLWLKSAEKCECVFAEAVSEATFTERETITSDLDWKLCFCLAVISVTLKEVGVHFCKVFAVGKA